MKTVTLLKKMVFWVNDLVINNSIVYLEREYDDEDDIMKIVILFEHTSIRIDFLKSVCKNDND